MLSKINFRKPRYVIPALIFLPLVFLGWNIIGIIDFEVEEEATNQTEGEINVEIPNPNMENMEIKSKYKNMLDDFGKVRDHSAVQNLEDEETESEAFISLYDESEIAYLDSLEEIKRNNLKEIQRLQDEINFANNIPSENGKEQTPNNSSDELLEQISLLQRIARGEEIKTPEQIAQEEERKARMEQQRREQEEKAKEQAPKDVLKADAINREYFNTVGKSHEEYTLIKAMLDETLKVVDGSRIRIRLMDDVILNDYLIKKGTYLFATITGFGSQRVRAKVHSIMVEDQYINVSLKIYDVDGLEGFYVPASTFRDLAKDAGSSAMGQNITMNSASGEQNFESFAFQTLQNVYQSASSAVSNNIKKNKATLKYNTTVYLINDNN